VLHFGWIFDDHFIAELLQSLPIEVLCYCIKSPPKISTETCIVSRFSTHGVYVHGGLGEVSSQRV